MTKALELTGQRFGRLTAVSRAETVRGPAAWNCDCDCGNKAVVKVQNLSGGRTRSCGCLARTGNNLRHGCRHTPEYEAWKSMKARCLNANRADFARYGGRGIKICERWQSFANFLADIGPRPSPKYSIGRVDNDGDYEPGNCRWETQTQQARNRRSTRLIEFNGEALCLQAWANRIGVTPTALIKRLRCWPIERAMLPQTAEEF